MTQPSPSGRAQGGWHRRRLAISMNTAAALALLAALVLMANYLSYRHYARWDWSRSKFYSLSAKSRSLLKSLTNRVDVIVFFQPHQEIFEDIDNLLEEYETECPYIHVERIDPDRDLARTEELMRTYRVDQANVVVFESRGRTKYIGAGDIVEYDYSTVPYGEPPSKVSFRGEQAFSSAIQDITRAKRPVVYFLQGHGERDPESFSRPGGYSQIAEDIRRDSIEVRSLVLGEKPSVPDDGDAVVIAGPTKVFSDPELALLRAYLDRKGRLMVLLDAMTTTGLEPLLAEWGIALADDVVVDSSRTLTGRELFVTDYGTHPVSGHLRGVTSVFYLPRSVEAAAPGEDEGAADKPHVVELAACSASGYAETDPAQADMKFDPQADRPGPISIAVAAERGPVPGIDVQIRPTRLVAFGDSDFVANGATTGGNADLFLSALNWLLEREELMGIAPKPAEQNRLVMTRGEIHALFWIVVGGLPAIVAVFGLAVWWRRRA